LQPDIATTNIDPAASALLRREAQRFLQVAVKRICQAEKNERRVKGQGKGREKNPAASG